MGNLPIDQKKLQKRTDEIERILKAFILNWNANPSHIKIKSIPNAAMDIATVYYTILNNNIKGEYLKEDGFVNRFKVASLTEISCMLISPIRIQDINLPQTSSAKTKLNARFATTAALQMLNGIYHLHAGLYLPNISNEQIKSAMNSHSYWVKYFLPDDNPYPIFLNSTFWEMFVAALSLQGHVNPLSAPTIEF
jgi:hypothetical protein